MIKNFKTKHEMGFTSEEIDLLLEDYPSVSKDKFDETLGTITCTMIDKEVIIYHHDVELALRCCLENRKMKSYEWD